MKPHYISSGCIAPIVVNALFVLSAFAKANEPSPLAVAIKSYNTWDAKSTVSIAWLRAFFTFRQMDAVQKEPMLRVFLSGDGAALPDEVLSDEDIVGLKMLMARSIDAKPGKNRPGRGAFEAWSVYLLRFNFDSARPLWRHLANSLDVEKQSEAIIVPGADKNTGELLWEESTYQKFFLHCLELRNKQPFESIEEFLRGGEPGNEGHAPGEE